MAGEIMIYGCIAEKLGHSFSADIHKLLFGYEYELKELTPAELDVFMREKNFKAINVTIPYKEKVIPFLDEISDTAKKIGAVNTIVNNCGYLTGYNTDFSGMSGLIKRSGISINGKKVLILGSGGTSKTAVCVAESLGCKQAIRVSRDGKENCITYSEMEDRHLDAEIIINTTPVGMYPKLNNSPVELGLFKNIEGVIDAVYNPLRSKIVCDAKKMGISAVGGLYMLVHQAAVAAEKFTGVSVSADKIEQVYYDMVRMKQNLVLTGMPGSGKSTIGKLLANYLEADFIDTDEEIVKREGKSIPEIFNEVGEVGFRKIETNVIESLSSRQHSVIATGGGAILNENNIQMLRENGIVYFLDRDIENIDATSDRPLSSNREDLMKRYNERYGLYCERCDRHIKIGNNAIENSEIIKGDFLDENSCN